MEGKENKLLPPPTFTVVGGAGYLYAVGGAGYLYALGGEDYLYVVGGAVAGDQVFPFLLHRVPDLQVVGLHGAASVVGRAIPRQCQAGPPDVRRRRNLGGGVGFVWGWVR